MFVIISVGHKIGLAVIPTAAISTPETLTTALKGLSMRLNMMVKGRVSTFDYSLFGHNIVSLPENTECAAVVSTILEIIKHAEFLKHDHITFTHTGDLVAFAQSQHASICIKCAGYEVQGLIDGTLTEMRREEERLHMFIERAKSGINQPEIFW